MLVPAPAIVRMLRSARLCAALLVTLLGAVPPGVGAQPVLPALPLPDCHTNGLSPAQDVDCEGMLPSTVTFGSPAELSRPAQGSIGVVTAPGTIDFRNDVDRGGEQSVIIALELPPLPDVVVANGDTLRTAVHIEWPTVFGPGNGLLNCKHTGLGFFQWAVSSCDFYSPGPGQGSGLFWRDTPCATTETTCTYRVRWANYQTRVNHPMILRAYVPWYLVYSRQLAGGGFDTCSSLGPQGCLAGSGSNWFTLAVSGPPPPLQIVGIAERLGARSFRFDGQGSGPDVVSWEWRDGGGLGDLLATTVSFEKTWEQSEIPAFGVDSMRLTIRDRWDRQKLLALPYSFLAPSGVEGPLAIDPLELVAIEDGVITLRAVVRNVGTGPLTNVFVLASEFLGEIAVGVEPDAVNLAAGEETAFTLTAAFGDRDSRRIEAQAFGTSESGTVLSAKRSRRVELEDGTTTSTMPSGTTTTTLPPAGTTTTVTQASAPGDTRVEVASNDGFTAGGYATLDPGGPNEETGNVVAFGSLVFAAPLAFAHAPGETVIAVPAPGGDTAGPAITISSPTPGTVVCRDTPLVATFTCADAGVGVAVCGGDVASGDVLDTATPGPGRATLRAWDRNGNTTAGTIEWLVQDPSGFPGLRCSLDALAAALQAAPDADLNPRSQQKLGKLVARLRGAVEAAEAASGKQRAKQLKAAAGLTKRLLAQVAKGAKTRKVSTTLAAGLRAHLEVGRGALSALLEIARARAS